MRTLKTILTSIIVVTFIACGGKEEKKGKFEYQSKKETKKVPPKVTSTTPVDMDNQGIGPIKDFSFEEQIDKDLATKGEGIFKVKCIACHKAAERFIGPPMKDIYERRNPTWVMNIMLNPDEMLEKDPIAVALLKEYNGVKMINQQLTEEEARALAEYFREL
ncbi:c-type cytochrome [Sungkyunkwania multivorans]|uniref:C-type cytochrome n=1 Tax=Sungkyunkwania multivorans TaxID=1173618 RepID=A0ABW3D2A1_9FLAO